MSKELSFTLLLEAETGQFVRATQQSEQSARAMFEQIRLQSQNVTQELQQASKSVTDLFNVRGNNEILSEIQAVEQGLKELQQQYKNNQISKQEFNRLNQAGQQKLKSLQQELNGTNNSLNNLNKGLSTVKTGITALASAVAMLGLGLGLQELANTADSYVNLTAKVKIATEQTGSFNQAMAGVHQVALATNSNLEETANLFTKLNTVGQEMGMSTQQAINLTQTVTQAIQLGGSSAEGSAAAVQQFIQAMNGGVLRGEEFNSIMENGFGLAEALAKGLGVTTGELRKMAEAGELSSERVIKAISSQSQYIDKQYAKLPTTIGNALQRIQTQWQILIGEFDKANGSSSAVAQFLVKFADGLGQLKDVLDDVGQGFVWIGSRLKQINSSTITALKETLTSAYNTVKSLISSVMSLGETLGSVGSSVLDVMTIFSSAFVNGEKNVSGLESALNVVRLALGALSDGATGVNIGFKLLLGSMQFLTAGLLNFQSKIQDFLGFDTLALKSQQASDRIFAQAEKNLKQARAS